MVMKYLKLINAQMAKVTHACKYKKEKLHRTNAPIWILLNNKVHFWLFTIMVMNNLKLCMFIYKKSLYQLSMVLFR
jgi:hypothetical protein